jgi:tetratricopeptide (TPR) repeat protein
MKRRFPIQVTIAAFIFYLVSLCHGVTVNSLGLTAKVAAWDWTPIVGQPLLWLLTLPLRLLPEAWIPLGLNVFSALTAALTLGLLTRTIQLLPWDWPWPEKKRWITVFPVLLACGLCGLELNFWQEATAASGEMLQLLLLAAAVWLLLEYRASRKIRWLEAAVFVWGLGMAENWVMQLTLPLFVAGIIWLEGINFFQRRFVLRLAILGLAGFAVYAVLPLANSLAPQSPLSFSEAWLASLKQSKQTLMGLYHLFWRAHRMLAVAAVLYFSVPLLACLVRLRDEGTANKFGVERFQTWLYRGLKVLLLLACIWLAFDPSTGLRQILQRQSGILLPLLTLDYLSALGAAFLAGNLLLIAQRPLPPTDYLPPSPLAKIPWRRLAVPTAALLLALVAVGLVARNSAAIGRMNFHPLERFGELVIKSLPTDGGVMLSDQPQKLVAWQAALARHPGGQKWQSVDTRLLPLPTYRARLDRRQPGGWLTDTNRHNLTPPETIRLLEQQARTNRLFYLHYTSGLLCERFYLEPAGAVYELKLRGKNPLDIPALSSNTIAICETFWSDIWSKGLVQLMPPPVQRPTGMQKRLQRLGYLPAPQPQDRLQASWHSAQLTGWAVAMQQLGHWSEARLRLEQALQLNPENISARLSLNCNTNHQAGNELGLAGLPQAAEQVGKLQRLGLVMQNNGPVDEPIFCFLLAYGYQQTGLPVQAIEQYERVHALAPDTPAPALALAEIYTRFGVAERAFPLINELRDQVKSLSVTNGLDVQLALLEADCWLTQTNPAQARTVLESVLKQHPDDGPIAHRIAGAYLAVRDYTNALRVVDAQLQKTPDDLTSLNLQAAILFQSGRATSAIPVLDHVLTMTNLPEVRLNRALSLLASGDLAVAEREYLDLDKARVMPGPVNYGLAEIAAQRHDTNQTVHYLQICLTNAPPGSPLWRQINDRLQKLQFGSTNAARKALAD